MMRSLRNTLVLVFVCLLVSGWAVSANAPWFTIDENNDVQLRVELFVSSTCPHCKKAEQFFKDIEAETPWIILHRQVINQDKSALEAFNQLLIERKEMDFAVPSVFFCDSRWVGFDTPETSGNQWLKAMNYCREQIAKNGKISPIAQRVLKEKSSASWYEASLIPTHSAMFFIPMMAIIDALNPCALFSVLTLFSFLMIQPGRKKQVLIAIGFLFIVGLAHHIQQVHTVFFYMVLAWWRIPAVLVGMALCIYVIAYHSGKQRKTYFNAVFFPLILLTALSVQMYQQLLTPNFSLIFRQWLIFQRYAETKEALCGLLYQFIYLLSIALIAIALMSFCHFLQRWLKGTRFFEAFSWYYLLIVGLILAAYPYLLGKLLVSFLVTFLTLIVTALGFKRRFAAKK